jgi:hypothetical protein
MPSKNTAIVLKKNTIDGQRILVTSKATSGVPCIQTRLAPTRSQESLNKSCAWSCQTSTRSQYSNEGITDRSGCTRAGAFEPWSSPLPASTCGGRIQDHVARRNVHHQFALALARPPHVTIASGSAAPRTIRSCPTFARFHLSCSSRRQS